MAGTETNEPGERRTPGERMAGVSAAGSRRLAEPPSNRYTEGARPGDVPSGTGLRGPLARALVIAAVGTAALVAVGAVFASTVGLLFTSAVAGAGIGLVLARAAVPPGDPRAVARRTVVWTAIALAISAVVVAGVATWLYARQEGGTLGLVDYLFTTFGPFVPGELLIAAIAAWWGASAGPVQS